MELCRMSLQSGKIWSRIKTRDQYWQDARSANSLRPYAGARTTYTIANCYTNLNYSGLKFTLQEKSVDWGMCRTYYAVWGYYNILRRFVYLGGKAYGGLADLYRPPRAAPLRHR